MAALIERNSVWTDKHLYDEAEKNYYEKLAKGINSNVYAKQSSLAGEVAKTWERIKQSLETVDDIKLPEPSSYDINTQNKISSIDKEVSGLKKELQSFKTAFQSLEKLVKDLDKKLSVPLVQSKTCPKPADNVCSKKPDTTKPPAKDDDDDDVDLFGSESEEDEEAKKVKEQRLAEYAAKKSKKPVLIAKSNIILDVKPWDDETDMKELEKEVRNITMDGLVWGTSKLVPLAYGIHKLQISCVVEDDKVSVDELQERIEKIEDYVQSMDIAAFNKV